MKTTQLHDKHIIFSIYNNKDTDNVEGKSLSTIYYINLNFWYKSPADYKLYREIIDLLTHNNEFIFDKCTDMVDENYFGKNIDLIYNNLKENINE
ncbi:MAG: hypothetical protein R3Y64_07670 [Peptostreptococcaceae bacterium]